MPEPILVPIVGLITSFWWQNCVYVWNRVGKEQDRYYKIKRLSQPEYDYFQRETVTLLASYGTYTNPEEQWQHLTSEQETRKDWISDEAWTNIELRKELKQSRCVDNFEEQYSKLTKIIQKQCRRDKNLYLKSSCTELEQHAEKYQTADLLINNFFFFIVCHYKFWQF